MSVGGLGRLVAGNWEHSPQHALHMGLGVIRMCSRSELVLKMTLSLRARLVGWDNQQYLRV